MTIAQKDHTWSLVLHAWAQKTPLRKKVFYWLARWAIWVLAFALLLWADAVGVDMLVFAFFVGVPLATSLFVSFAISAIVGRKRPFAQHGFDPAIGVRYLGSSFPSDHATCATSLGLSAFFFSPTLGVLAIIGAICIAVARVGVGVHYLSDIVAGALVAGCSLALLILLTAGPVG